MSKVPDAAEIVIVGGGIMGCSLAYHLAKAGKRDVLLLEQYQLSAGTTWHAAGLVGQLRSNENLTRLAAYGAQLYGELEGETGQATGFKRNGALTVAQTAERFVELKRLASLARRFDVECHVISPTEARTFHPMIEVGDLVGALWLPRDGQINPSDLTAALGKGARQAGARLVEGVRVVGLRVARGRVVGVETDAGAIACEQVALCAGMWTRDLAAKAGVNVPLHAAEHMYAVTETLEGVTPNLPVLRDHDSHIYVKEDAGKLLFGGFEPNAKPFGTEGVEDHPPFGLFNEDWDQFSWFLEGAFRRLPVLETAGVRQLLVGPESFTPDNAYILGETPEVDGLFVGAGFNSIGIASGGGAGKALAEWMIAGESPMDLWSIDARRIHPYTADRTFLRERTTEAVGTMYAMHWPYRQFETGRNRRLSPFHERHRAAGAWFGVSCGWERPLWYAPEGQAPEPGYTYGRQHWWPYAEAEAAATREAAALYDQTAFGKLLVEGADAFALLQRLCTADLDVPAGRAVYTQMLNARGGIEADLTVTRLDESRFFIVTGSTVAVKDRTWLRRQAGDARVRISDVTDDWAVIGLMGPQARERLAELTQDDVSRAAFPFSTCRTISVCGVEAMTLRLSYVGELGFELYLPFNRAAPVWDALVAAGCRPAGALCMDGLRLEKNFRHWGHDLGADDTPLEAGLGFLVNWDKPGGFLGRDALLAQRERGVTKRLVLFTLEEGEPLLLHEEPIYRDGRLVGALTSGNRAFYLRRPIGLGYVEGEAGVVDRDWLLAGHYQVEVAGERFRARPWLAAPWDPRAERMRG